MRCILAALALTLFVPACAARSASPTTVPARVDHSDARERLRRDLDALFNAAPVAHAQWAVNVYSPQNAETLYGLNTARFMVPASNQKVLTTAVAAERLGWDFRFKTRLVTTGDLAPDGTLSGDLVIVGDGDPTINPRHPERWRAFDDWAAALRSRGIKVINGSLIGDDDAFEEPGWGVGWAWDNLQYGYGAPASALQYNENQIELMIGPGVAVGTPAIISTSPPDSGLIIRQAVSTLPEGAETMLDIARIPGTPTLAVRGQIAMSAKPATITAAVDNPTRFYLAAVREAFRRSGIVVSGGLVDIDDLPVAPDLAAATELLVDYSVPLSEIVDVTMKWSRNIYAESLLLAMAEPGEPANGTNGLRAMRETLATWGIAPESYLPRDGSGLSRYDYVTTDVLTRVLTHLMKDPRHADPYRSTLPVAGVSGSLANRMKGTPAEGRVVAKTGTLSNVRTLSGYATTLEGETLVFAMMANNFRVPTADIDAVMERALIRVIAMQNEERRTKN